MAIVSIHTKRATIDHEKGETVAHVDYQDFARSSQQILTRADSIFITLCNLCAACNPEIDGSNLGYMKGEDGAVSFVKIEGHGKDAKFEHLRDLSDEEKTVFEFLSGRMQAEREREDAIAKGAEK